MAGVSKLVAAFALAVAAAPLTDATLRPEIDKLVAAVTAARHLPFHGPLPAHALGPEEMRRAIALAVGEGTDNAATRTEGELLKRLGLMPTGTGTGELAAQAHAVATTPVARYDAATATLLVPSSVPLGAQREALAHEIAHAVADQRFGLRRFLRVAPDGGPRLDGDAERARLALVEGDAMLAGLEVDDPRENFLGTHALGALAGRLRASSHPASDAAPSWFDELGQFTHVDGLLFVARVRAQRPWSAVDELWNEPPVSSEQILHPEKYDACEGAIAVDEATLPALPGFGRPTASDVLGELVVRTWLESALPPEIAARAATGWGGDRAGLYAPGPPAPVADGGAPMPTAPLAWLTVWDDAGEADDFARGARQVLAKMSQTMSEASGAPATTGATDDREREAFPTPNGTFALARKGDAVALLFAAPEPAAPALAVMLEAAHPRAGRRAAPRPRRAAQPGCPRRDRAAGSG